LPRATAGTKKFPTRSRAVASFGKLGFRSSGLDFAAALPAMKRKFLRTLVLVVAAFAAMSLFVCADDFREYDAVYSQSEMLKESAQDLNGHRYQQLSFAARVAPNKNGYSRGSATAAKPFALVCLSTRVLLC
jgi:hypothetical protein